MKATRKLVAIIFSTILITSSLLSGCRKMEPQPTISEVTSSTDSSATESQTEVTGALNPLTGIYDLPEQFSGQRPIAVMINNHHASWPQYSISQADLVYELPVEGGYTRLMAVYMDNTKAPVYGSIRSARHDFVELAKSLNGILIHWGGSDAAYSSIQNNGVDHIDGMVYSDRYFYTDRSHSTSIEHCRFMKSTQMDEALQNLNLDRSGETSAVFTFGDAAHPVSFTDTNATEVTVPLSGDITVTYTYDTQQQKYQKGEYGETTLDGGTSSPVLIENAFLLFAPVSLMSDGVHKDVSLNSGTGYYLTHGTKTAIQWSKGNPSSPLQMKLEDGSPLTVNPGNSWILFVPTSVEDNVTFGAVQ